MRPCFIVLLPSPGWTKKKQQKKAKKTHTHTHTQNTKQTCIDLSNAVPVTAAFMASFICRVFRPSLNHESSTFLVRSLCKQQLSGFVVSPPFLESVCLLKTSHILDEEFPAKTQDNGYAYA